MRRFLIITMILLASIGGRTAEASCLPQLPSDPFLYEANPTGPMDGSIIETYQWPMGFDSSGQVEDSRINEAWELTCGHAYLGIFDLGIASRNAQRRPNNPGTGQSETRFGIGFRPVVDGEIVALGALATGGNKIELIDRSNPLLPLAMAETMPGTELRWRYVNIASVPVEAGTEYLVVVRNLEGMIAR